MVPVGQDEIIPRDTVAESIQVQMPISADICTQIAVLNWRYSYIH